MTGTGDFGRLLGGGQDRLPGGGPASADPVVDVLETEQCPRLVVPGGWGVLIQGPAHHVPLDEPAKVTDSDVTPWAGGDRQLYIRIVPHQITGRRIHGR
ncbi:hypothetical protein [Nonomuraea sp. NPDC049141]|uniref:hypothetical protein n=1 Tax=Nonomuraea sp. NPDC049141 TaxID=3155500 RepID=UPI00340F4E9A